MKRHIRSLHAEWIDGHWCMIVQFTTSSENKRGRFVKKDQSRLNYLTLFHDDIISSVDALQVA